MTRNQPSRLLAVLVTCSVLAAGIPVVAASNIGNATFEENTVTVTRGDTVKIPVKFDDTATVWIGSEQTGFLLEVVLSGSGKRTIEIDTYATTGSPSSFVSGASSVTLHTPPLQRPLVPATYMMNVTVDGVEQDIGSLTVEPREEMSAETRVAPQSLLDDGTPSIDAAMKASVLGDTVAVGDVAVIPIEESGLENALNTDDLDGDAGANGVRIQFSELDPEPNTDPETLVLTEDPGLSIVPDLENDRFMVLWDTSTRTLQPYSNHSWQLDVVLTETNGLVEADTTVASTRVQLAEPTVSVDGDDHVTFYPWDDATIVMAGEANLAPGTTLNVRAKSIDPPMLVKDDVTVARDGGWKTALDLSDVGPLQSVPVWVLGYEDQTERTVVRYAEEASFAFHDQVSNGKALTVDSVHLGAGGFVELRADGSRIGVSETLPPGTHDDVVVRLDEPLTESGEVTAVARLDRDLDGAFDESVDRPYEMDDGARVESSAYLQLQGVETTTTTTPPSTTTTPPSTAETTTPTETTMTTTTHLAASGPLVERTPIPALAAAESDASVPFPAWTAVVAVVAGGLLARGRGGSR